jgi:hypothetical protein
MAQRQRRGRERRHEVEEIGNALRQVEQRGERKAEVKAQQRERGPSAGKYRDPSKSFALHRFEFLPGFGLAACRLRFVAALGVSGGEGRGSVHAVAKPCHFVGCFEARDN